MPTFYGTEVLSRLMLGTAQYPSPAILADAFRRSGAGIATVSVRREAGGDHAGQGFWALIRDLGVAVLPNPAAMALLLALRLASFLFTRNATARLDVRVRARQPIKTMQRIVFGAMATNGATKEWNGSMRAFASSSCATTRASTTRASARMTPISEFIRGSPGPSSFGQRR